MSRRRRFQISTRDPKDRQGSCIGLVTGVKKRPGEIHGAISIVPHPAYVHSGWNCKMNSRLHELPINRRSGNSPLASRITYTAVIPTWESVIFDARSFFFSSFFPFLFSLPVSSRIFFHFRSLPPFFSRYAYQKKFTPRCTPLAWRTRVGTKYFNNSEHIFEEYYMQIRLILRLARQAPSRPVQICLNRANVACINRINSDARLPAAGNPWNRRENRLFDSRWLVFG